MTRESIHRAYRGFTPTSHLTKGWRALSRWCDKRGTGLSDHGSQLAALETRMEDLRAVLDAAGASRAVVLGAHDGCSMAALYAATYPERTRALALFHPFLKGPGIADRAMQEELSAVRSRWGTQEFCDKLLEKGSPTLYASEEDRRWMANWLRVGASPAVAYTLNRALWETDMRDVLPAVRVPTLVLYRSSWAHVALDVAARMPSARVMRLSGDDEFPICGSAFTWASASSTRASRRESRSSPRRRRIAATAGAGEVMVSSTVRDLVAGSGLTFEDRGQREFKGVPGTWQLYVASREASGANSSS